MTSTTTDLIVAAWPDCAPRPHRLRRRRARSVSVGNARNKEGIFHSCEHNHIGIHRSVTASTLKKCGPSTTPPTSRRCCCDWPDWRPRSETLRVSHATIEALTPIVSLTFSGSPGKLEVLHDMAARVEAADVPGIFLEAGVAMGGSAIVIAQTKAPDRPLRLYDVFAMVPPPGDEDDAQSHAGYQALASGVIEHEHDRTLQNYLEHMDDLLSFTRENMRRVGIDPEKSRITFVKGLYEDTLFVEEPVAFAHIDCDWYDSVRLCIERIADQVSVGGIVLFDDLALTAFEAALKGETVNA